MNHVRVAQGVLQRGKMRRGGSHGRCSSTTGYCTRYCTVKISSENHILGLYWIVPMASLYLTPRRYEVLGRSIALTLFWDFLPILELGLGYSVHPEQLVVRVTQATWRHASLSQGRIGRGALNRSAKHLRTCNVSIRKCQWRVPLDHLGEVLSLCLVD